MAKLDGEGKRKFLREKLEEQRNFLRKSIAEFARGDLAEAVRMAIAIRVLIHETGASKPLLKQLSAHYLSLTILDRATERPAQPTPPGVQSLVIMSVPVSVNITDKGVFFNPALDTSGYAPSILGKWWTRHSLIIPGFGGFARKEIILGLANKEGGGHVDTNISAKYQGLLQSKSLQIGWGKDSVTPINLSRYMTAQAAVELLYCLDKNYPSPS